MGLRGQIGVYEGKKLLLANRDIILLFLNTKESGRRVEDLTMSPLLGRLLQSALLFFIKKNIALCDRRDDRVLFPSLEASKLWYALKTWSLQ